MAMPTDVPIIDCMISFPIEDKKKLYEFITKQTKDSQSKDEYQFPVEYMFKDVPDESKSGDDPVAVTLREMDKHNIERGLIGIGSGNSERALEEHPEVRVDRQVLPGTPRAALLGAAADAQLLVVGARGRGGFDEMSLGSIAQAVLLYAPGPVAVVRPAA